MRIVEWTQEQMTALRVYAEAHPMTARDVLAGRVPPAGDVPGHVLALKGGMRVVYSIETDQPGGPCRHLSVSVDTAGQWPNPGAVLALAQEMGFRPDLADGTLWQDQVNEAINWVQFMAPPTVC